MTVFGAIFMSNLVAVIPVITVKNTLGSIMSLGCHHIKRFYNTIPSYDSHMNGEIMRNYMDRQGCLELCLFLASL